MTNQELKKDFITFEENHYFSDLSKNNFYCLLDNLDISNFIINCIKRREEDLLLADKIFKNNVNDLRQLLSVKDSDFKNFSYFKSNADILYGYLLLFLIKTFSFKLKNSKIQKEEFELNEFNDFFLDKNDFVNIFLDYIFKFFLFNEIKHKKIFSYNKHQLRVFSFRFIEFCSKNNLITSEDFKTKNKRYKILTFKPFLIPFFSEVILHTKKFEIYVRLGIDPYIYGSHFSSIFSVTKQATYSNSVFKIQLEQVDDLTQRSFYISKPLLLKNYKILLKSLLLDESADIENLFNSYSLKIHNFLKEGDLISLKVYHSKLSRILTLIRIKTLINVDFESVELFSPFMFCFRGRVYDLGNLSFTFYKEFRYCVYSGIYDTEDETFHPINSQINGTLDEYLYLFKKYFWFRNLSLIRKRSCAWLFIALGAMKKIELGKKVHISKFLIKGIEMWDSKEREELFSDSCDKMEFNYILFLINELITSKILKKWLFWKDATASCFQHLLLVLGERDKNSYKICNLNSTEYWYDPYSYLISDFFEKKKTRLANLSQDDVSPLYFNSNLASVFSRKRLKKVIMTETYGAGFAKLSSYFFLDLNLDKFSPEERIFILENWKDFFNYLSNENVLFSQSSTAINKIFTEKKLFAVINPDGTEVDYSCFKIKITQGEYYADKKRHTYRIKGITTDIDKKQFDISLRANFIQTQDAVLARKYISCTGMWTVHDCFSIDFLNITFMVSQINELMNGEFYDLKINLKNKKLIFSIFIIL